MIKPNTLKIILGGKKPAAAAKKPTPVEIMLRRGRGAVAGRRKNALEIRGAISRRRARQN